MNGEQILVVGGYGEVGQRVARQLEATRPGRVIVAGRHPEQATVRARKIDVDDPASVDRALEGVGVAVVCVRQRQPHVLRSAVHRGIAYTSIAPPKLSSTASESLRAEAKRTGARIVLGAGLEPGITSVLVRIAAERLGQVDAIETALLLGLGDAYGADSMAFIFEEVRQRYAILIDGRDHTAHAFERPKVVTFPAPIGERRAYTMPFSDQFSYPTTIGAKTAIARIALDPPWLATVLAVLLRAGLRRALTRASGRGAVHALIEQLRSRYSGREDYALVIEVRGAGRMVRSTLVGRQQARATAVAAAAITEALWSREMDTPGVWFAEQVIAPQAFLARLAAAGLAPSTEELSVPSSPRSDVLAPAVLSRHR